jgi:hypothetical protein
MCGLEIKPELLYDEEQLRTHGLDDDALAKGRRLGTLACSEIARGRRLYLGRDLLAWIEACRKPKRPEGGRGS